MNIILKYILKSMYEKKLRTFLIILSIAISSALIFASSSITGSLVKMFHERMKQFYGSSDFIIHYGGINTSRNFNVETAAPLRDHTEYIIGGFQGSAEYRHLDEKNYSFSLKGYDFERHINVSPVDIIDEIGLYPFEGKKVILGSSTAKRLGLKLGDTIDLKTGQTKHKFTLSAIAAPLWFLYDDGESNCALVPQNTLATIYNMRGRDNAIYVKLKNPDEKRQLLDKFRNLYRGCGFSMFSITTDIDIPLKLLTVIVCFMSIFIIYSSFKVITLERLPAIGTFRSIGASRNTTNLVLLAESAIYGVVGGLLGCVLGIGILYAMTSTTKNEWTSNMDTILSFTPLQLFIAFLLSAGLCLASSMVPIIKASRISIKDIVLNTLAKHRTQKPWKGIAGIILMSASIAGPHIIPKNLALFLDMACLVALAISAILLIPYITRIFVKLLEGLYIILFGNIGVLAAKNLRENKSILNSISLLCIGISTLVMVATATDSMSKEVLNEYASTYNFQINMRISGASIRTEQLVRAITGVKSTLGIYMARGISIQGLNENLRQIDGIGSTAYFDYWKIDIGLQPEDLINELNSGRKILVSNALKHNLGLSKGDTLPLKMPKGVRTYTVTGFYDTSLSNGSHAMISEKYLKLDTGMRYYTYINIKTSTEPSQVVKEIKSIFKRDNPWIETIQESEARAKEDNGQISNILIGFSVLTLLIGIVGVFNNLLISFIERKHSLAVLKSIGMSRSQTVKMILIEAMTGGFIGGITGVIVGCLQLYIVPYIMRATGQYFPIHYNLGYLVAFIGAAVLITVTASVSPAAKSSRLDIVASIKFE